MISCRQSLRAALAAGTALLATACVTSTGNYDITSEVSAEKALLQFRGGPLAGSVPKRVVHANPWEYVEYASGTAGALTYEMAYVTHVGTNTTVEYPHTIRKMVGTWRHNGSVASFGNAVRSPSPVEGMWYIPYTLAGRSESCAGFQAEWDSPPLDPERRPGRVIFGYLCAAPGTTLSPTTVESALANISIRGVTERIRERDPKQVALDFGDSSPVPPQARSAALQLARSGPGEAGGNPAFPFNYVVTFITKDGGEASPN